MDEDLMSLHPAIRGLKTVCRCNNIKYRTIEKAILAGAHSVAEVAAKTKATTGYCGGTCTPKIQAMLAELVPGFVAPPPSSDAATPGEEDAWWIKR